MKAHISTKETEDRMKEGLLKIKQAGLKIGTKAMAGVIYEKATAEGRSAEEKLNDIIEFCKKGLAIRDEEEQPNG